MQRPALSRTLLTCLFLAAVFMLALTKMQDTDAWMHLSLGKLVWQERGFPSAEVFLYTHLGKPVLYTSWIFGLLLYLAHLFTGAAGVVLLKASVVTALFFIMLADSQRPYRNQVVSVMVLGVVAVMLRHRFVERPDLFALLFLALTISVLNRSFLEGKRLWYGLPLIHLLWANMHSSITLIAVPYGAFLIGGILQRSLFRKGWSVVPGPSNEQLGTLGLFAAVSFLLSLLNPNGFPLYTFGANFLSSPSYQLMIYELNPASWTLSRWPHLFGAAAVLALLAAGRRVYVPHVLLVVPFLVLPFRAVRFLSYLGVVAGPVVARSLAGWISARPWRDRFDSPRAQALAAGWLIVCVLFSFTGTFSVGGIVPPAGVGVDLARVPERALAFMDREGISGRVLNEFDWGGYIAWRDFPKRSVFIDPRVSVPPDELNDLIFALSASPHRVDRLEARYRFGSILVGYNRVMDDLRSRDAKYAYAFTHPDWALVYWDDLALVFIKRTGPFGRVAEEREYRAVRPETVVFPVLTAEEGKRDRMLLELRRAVAESGSVRAHVLLGALYNGMGAHQDAVAVLDAVRSRPGNYCAAVDAVRGYAMRRIGDREEALRSYERSLACGENAVVLHELGAVRRDASEWAKALPVLERAFGIAPRNPQVYRDLLDTYRKLGRNEDAQRFEERNRASMEAAAGEELFRTGLAAYGRRDYQAAIESFTRAAALDPGNPAIWSNLGYAYLDRGDIERALECQQRAVTAAPGYANAHYGLAIIYTKRGMRDAARREWTEFLRLEPEGYYAQKARAALQAMNAPR